MISCICLKCGNSLKYDSDDLLCTCDSCGAVNILPQRKDNRLIAAFNSATQFMLSSDFYNAKRLLSSIIDNYGNDYYALLLRALCRYGVIFVRPLANGSRIPHCCKAEGVPFSECDDYLAALSLCDSSVVKALAVLAKAIDESNAAMTNSKRDKNYSVYLSFAENELNSDLHTKESYYALALYSKLTKDGISVFYPPKSLNNNECSDELSAYSALSSSAVFLSLATNDRMREAAELNERLRIFYSMKQQDDRKLIIEQRDEPSCDVTIPSDELYINKFTSPEALDVLTDLIKQKLLAASADTFDSDNAEAAARQGFALIIENNGMVSRACELFLRAINLDATNIRAHAGLFLYGKDSLHHAKELRKHSANVCSVEKELYANISAEYIAEKYANADDTVGIIALCRYHCDNENDNALYSILYMLLATHRLELATSVLSDNPRLSTICQRSNSESEPSIMPIISAAVKNCFDAAAVQLLLEFGASANSVRINASDSVPVLFDAVAFGRNRSVISLLIEHGANVNQLCDFRSDSINCTRNASILSVAVLCYATADIIELLIQSGADPNRGRIVISEGRGDEIFICTLTDAIRNACDIDEIRALIAKNGTQAVDLSAMCEFPTAADAPREMRSILSDAIICGQSVELVTLLLDSGCDPNSVRRVNVNGHNVEITALRDACIFAYDTNIMNALQSRGATVVK